MSTREYFFNIKQVHSNLFVFHERIVNIVAVKGVYSEERLMDIHSITSFNARKSPPANIASSQCVLRFRSSRLGLSRCY